MLQINTRPSSPANVVSTLASNPSTRPTRSTRILREASWPSLPAARTVGLEIARPARAKRVVGLRTGRWSPQNRAFLNAFLASLVAQPRSAVRPAAVFDWDETSMLGDVTNTWLHSTFQHLEISLTPEQLAATLATFVGSRDYLLSGIHLPSLRDDILDAYTELHPFIVAGDVAAAQKLPAYHDFRTKMVIYFEQYYYDPENPNRDSYEWLQWFVGLHQDDIDTRVAHAFETYSKSPNPTETWGTVTPGRTGILTHTFKTQPAKRPEMMDLMRCLRSARVDVFVMSGSIEPCVRALAKHLDYPLKRENIFGSHAIFDANGRLTGAVVSPSEYPPCWKAGKSEIIRRYVQRDPVLVSGDSDGDSNMLLDFVGTMVRLIIDSERRGGIRAFHEQGAVPPNAQKGKVRTLVQAWS